MPPDAPLPAPDTSPPPGETTPPARKNPRPPGSAQRTPGALAIRVEVLGALRITTGDREIEGGLRKARKLLAFLAVHPGGVSGEAISEALWPGSPPGHSARQRSLALRKLRDLLRAATGLPPLPPQAARTEPDSYRSFDPGRLHLLLPGVVPFRHWILPRRRRTPIAGAHHRTAGNRSMGDQDPAVHTRHRRGPGAVHLVLVLGGPVSIASLSVLEILRLRRNGDFPFLEGPPQA